MNPLVPFFAYIARKRSERALRMAEHRRRAIMDQIADRRSHKREFRPMVGMLRDATNASLMASCGKRRAG